MDYIFRVLCLAGITLGIVAMALIIIGVIMEANVDHESECLSRAEFFEEVKYTEYEECFVKKGGQWSEYR